MASTTYKAQAIAAELADRLKVRSSLAVAVSQDTDKNPLIQVGSALTTGSEACLIKVEAANWPEAQDVLGNAALAFTPHTIRMLQEAAPAGGLTSADKLQILAQVAAMGTEVKLCESSSGSGVVVADLSDDTKVVSSYAPDAWRPLISQQ
jgi:hypothetical protein